VLFVEMILEIAPFLVATMPNEDNRLFGWKSGGSGILDAEA